jgi:diacylglycerol kinase (ATP)
MTEELRIKKIQMGEAKIGLLFNPLSGRIRKRKGVIMHAMEEIPGAIIREATSAAEFNATVSDFMATGIDLLVIAGGDGTVQAVLSHLFTAHPLENWPIFAILPGGTTNMTALDLVNNDVLEDATQNLSKYLLTRTLPSLVRRHVLCIEQIGSAKVYGMFFGVGIIARAVIFSRSKIKQMGITGEVYSGLIMFGYIVGLILGCRKGAWAPAQTTTIKVGGKTCNGAQLILFASALDRLLFNMNPYWGQEQKPIHVTFIEQHRKKFLRAIFPLISGKGATLKEHDGYHSHNSSTLELVIDDDYVVDGESYRAASQNGPLKISAAGPVTFLTW